MGPQRHSYWRHCDKRLFVFFFNYTKKKSKTRRRAGRCRMDPHAKESGKQWASINSGGGRGEGGLWFVSLFLGQSFPEEDDFWFSQV